MGSGVSDSTLRIYKLPMVIFVLAQQARRRRHLDEYYPFIFDPTPANPYIF